MKKIYKLIYFTEVRRLQGVLIMLMLFSINVMAQNTRSISGRVVDETNQPIPGVTVRIKGSTGGTSTDPDGNYTLSVKSSNVLVFSMLGSISKEVPVDNQTRINVTLMPDNQTLKDVVVIGYGTANKKDVTGSVTSIKSEEFNQGVMVNPAQLLQGKVAGLNVTKSGDPNAKPSTILRGPSTLREGAAQEPFYVIDGVPGASIDLLAPSDIENIDILKDASSTAIYGSRAANGVIIVTTKRSKSGQARLSYSGYAAVEKVSKKYDMLSAPELRQYLVDNKQTLNPVDDDGSDTNWQSLLERTGYSQNHNLSYGGAAQSADYGASVNYLDNKGILKNTSLKRTIVRGYLNQKFFNDRLKLGLTITNSNSKSSDINQSQALPNMLFFLPTVSPFNTDGTYKENYNRIGSGTRNPLSIVDNNIFDNLNNKTLINGMAQVNILDGLRFTASISSQRDQNSYSSYLNSQSGLARGVNGQAQKIDILNKSQVLESYFNYDKTFGKHSLKLLGGYSWQEDRTNDGFGIRTQNFSNDNLSYNNLFLSNPSLLSQIAFNDAPISTLRLISYYGRVQYNYNEKYLFQASLRNDGSSAFGKNNRWGLFPAVSAGWRIIGEDFMQAVPVISDLKLRAGYGVSGNSLGFDAFSSLLIYGTLSGSNKFLNNGNISNAIGPVRNPNPDLKWESTATTNIGLDFGLFKDRITGSVDFYVKKTSDLIYDRYEVSTTQFFLPTITANVGKIKNTGVEFSLNAVAVKTNNFKWTTSPNIAHNKNVVETLSDDFYKIDLIRTASLGGQGQSGNFSQIIQPGYALGTFNLWNYAGKNAAGVSTFINAAGQTIATQPLTTDAKIAGDAQPKLIYGWANSFNYKNWDLNFLVRGVLGNKILNATKASLNNPAGAKNQNIPRFTLGESFNDNIAYLISDRFIESGSYLRLDNATLGYTIRPKTTSIKAIRLYVTANNLFVITNYTGIDPEINIGGLTPGIDNNNYYPKTRTFSFGVTASF
ncbi:SusC/RagA family TonB-linked outer membrane protein [Pedobacter alluvionis]|uniref:Iron complex outermembrane receptor protein n=1 Tax=Pedobacter alluvionis TaxID=475253 RepID=A0A497Y437_9SPHI|nr:TonB-dependent receptor [Pedobacter alluvionis]RLJ76827.1 iron complex outermembrane receptor protein [Pedobacter alluvionis]TFB33912.1 TonB-dependent receptor [Pedobacter alluvionis]